MKKKEFEERKAIFMLYEILFKGSANAILQVALKEGEHFKADSGAMVTMDGGLHIKGKLDGGLFKGLGRKLLSGDTFFFQEINAMEDGEGSFAPAYPGDIQAIEMDGSEEIIIQKGGFLGGSENIDVSTKMQNLVKGFFSGEGFFVLRARGTGTLFVSSYGGILRRQLGESEQIFVDNQHLVAWTGNTKYEINKASSKGWISSFTSGEGLVCRFTGPGEVYFQTRNSKAFGAWVFPFLPLKNKKN